jgi:hypothetical protein
MGRNSSSIVGVTGSCFFGEYSRRILRATHSNLHFAVIVIYIHIKMKWERRFFIIVQVGIKNFRRLSLLWIPQRAAACARSDLLSCSQKNKYMVASDIIKIASLSFNDRIINYNQHMSLGLC